MRPEPETDAAQNWEELLRWKPGFPALIHKWLETMRMLVVRTESEFKEDDLVGGLIVAFMSTSLSDLRDLMTLTHRNSHYGAQKILRTLFERTVTLKYISEHPDEAQRFLDYDAIDWELVLTGIQKTVGLGLSEPSRSNLAAAAQKARLEYKQEKCSACKKPRYLGWSSLNSKDMADRVNLGHLYLHAFLIPSKLIHPTYWGLRAAVSESSPMLNTLKCTHELMLQMTLIHMRHFVPTSVTPLVADAIGDFLSIWVFSETSFGGLLTRGELLDGRLQIYY